MFGFIPTLVTVAKMVTCTMVTSPEWSSIQTLVTLVMVVTVSDSRHTFATLVTVVRVVTVVKVKGQRFSSR